MENTFEWPETFEESFEHYHIPKGYNNILVLGDVHLPYHSRAALDEAIDYGIKKNVDAILLNGDIIDCYQLSVFRPDPRNRKFSEEIEAFKQFIYVLKTATGAKIYYKLGNHEERYEKIMIDKCPEFLDIAEFDFENILGCNEMGVEVIRDQRIIFAGKLPVIHGHEIGMKSAIVNPARTLFLKTKKTAMCSHLHIPSQHTSKDIEDKVISCWSTGHLGDPHPKYRRLNDWVHGCARIEKDDDGDFEVINLRLVKNRLYRA